MNTSSAVNSFKDLSQEQKDKLESILNNNPTIDYDKETDIDKDGDYVYDIHTYDKHTIGDVLNEIAKI